MVLYSTNNQLEGSGGDVTVNGSAFIDLKYQPGIGECRIKCYKLQSSRPFEEELHHAEIEYDCLKQQHIYSIHLHIHQWMFWHGIWHDQSKKISPKCHVRFMFKFHSKSQRLLLCAYQIISVRSIRVKSMCSMNDVDGFKQTRLASRISKLITSPNCPADSWVELMLRITHQSKKEKGTVY